MGWDGRGWDGRGEEPWMDGGGIREREKEREREREEDEFCRILFCRFALCLIVTTQRPKMNKHRPRLPSRARLPRPEFRIHARYFPFFDLDVNPKGG